jgi:hypothetical protein
MDAGNAPARELAGRAASAAENQAQRALKDNNTPRAVEIYKRLSGLFPDREEYLAKLEAIQKPVPQHLPVPDISGEWSGTTTGGSKQQWTIRGNGTAILRFHVLKLAGQYKGTWTCTSKQERTFEFRWEEGNSDEVTLSSDGQVLEGLHHVTTAGPFNGTYTIHLSRKQ